MKQTLQLKVLMHSDIFTCPQVDIVRKQIASISVLVEDTIVGPIFDTDGSTESGTYSVVLRLTRVTFSPIECWSV